MGAGKIQQQQQSPKAKYSLQYPLGNHLWVNTERLNASLNPLCRSRILDRLAREHAQAMADQCKVFKSTIQHQELSIQENCLMGPSIQTIHKLTMAGSPTDESRSRILNATFEEFGMGAVKGDDGNIYICQLFC